MTSCMRSWKRCVVSWVIIQDSVVSLIVYDSLSHVIKRRMLKSPRTLVTSTFVAFSLIIQNNIVYDSKAFFQMTGLASRVRVKRLPMKEWSSSLGRPGQVTNEQLHHFSNVDDGRQRSPSPFAIQRSCPLDFASKFCEKFRNLGSGVILALGVGLPSATDSTHFGDDHTIMRRGRCLNATRDYFASSA
jgi:hypothetical protein